MGLFSREQTKRFGDDFTAHTGKASYNPEKHTYVNYYWKWSASKGSSGWSAAKMADMMGFDLMVLCGIPLNPGNYADGTLAMPMQNPKVIDIYREFILGDTKIHHKVKSMSGWTKELFGGIT